MRLSGQKCKELQAALIDAFSTTTSLERMLLHELDKNLRAIAGEDSLQDIVFKLIQAANAEEWVEDLVRVASESNPGNRLLKDIAEEILLTQEHETLSISLPSPPAALETWEKNSHEFIEQLLCTLNKPKQLNTISFFINSFLLSSKFIEEIVLDEEDIKEKLKILAIRPVSQDGICPLIVFSEWCRKIFLTDRNEFYNKALAEEIKNWQNQVIKDRKGAKIPEIKRIVETTLNNFKEKINNEELRIQIEIEPQLDVEKNTGQGTGLFLLNMNLWIKSQEIPLGMFAENVVLKPQRIEQDASEEKSDILRMCLEKDDVLSDFIRQARFSLPERVKLNIEIFVPLDFYQEPLEKIDFLRGRKREPLGKEYPIFINSFERYFDEGFREIRDEIREKKENLWNNNLDCEICYIHTEQSELDLQMIEETKAIALWSRCLENPLIKDKDIKESEWKEWREKIHELRKNNKDLEVTLFWDDLYPKPSRRSRRLNTKVVE